MYFFLQQTIELREVYRSQSSIRGSRTDSDELDGCKTFCKTIKKFTFYIFFVID